MVSRRQKTVALDPDSCVSLANILLEGVKLTESVDLAREASQEATRCASQA